MHYIKWAIGSVSHLKVFTGPSLTSHVSKLLLMHLNYFIDHGDILYLPLLFLSGLKTMKLNLMAYKVYAYDKNHTANKLIHYYLVGVLIT